MACQSDTTKPWNPRLGVPLLSVPAPFSLVVIRYWLAWSFSPFQLLYEIMTEPTLFDTADWYGGRSMGSNVCSEILASPSLRSGAPLPQAVCPSPIKCFAVARILVGPNVPLDPWNPTMAAEPSVA